MIERKSEQGRKKGTLWDGATNPPPKSRRDAGATSRAAANSMKNLTGAGCMKVLQAFIDAGPGGLTRDEACVSTGLNPNTLRPRCVDLLEAGMIKKTSMTRETISGRKAGVLVVTDKGVERGEGSRDPE